MQSDMGTCNRQQGMPDLSGTCSYVFCEVVHSSNKVVAGCRLSDILEDILGIL